MKVQFSATVDVDSEVNISIEEITSALREALHEAESVQENEFAGDREKMFSVHQFVNTVYQCLSAVTDDMVGKVSSYHREMIARGLREQADRYSVEQKP